MNNSLEIIAERKYYYHTLYRQILLVNLLLVLVIIGTEWYRSFLINNPPEAKYFATNSYGQIIALPAANINHLKDTTLRFNPDDTLVDFPAITKADLDKYAKDKLILYWAEKAMLEINNYDYVNLRSAMLNIRDYFTLGGYKKWISALQKSQNLNTVAKAHVIVYAEIDGQSRVISQGLNQDGRYTWNVQVPLKIAFYNAGIDIPILRVISHIEIVRDSTLRVPFFGVSITTLNMSDLSNIVSN